MVNFSMTLSEAEHKLIQDIQSLQYGEIYDVEILEEAYSVPLTVSRQARDLVNLIRGGERHFHMIQIHQSEPAYAESPCVTRYSGLRARKRHKFN